MPARVQWRQLLPSLADAGSPTVGSGRGVGASRGALGPCSRVKLLVWAMLQCDALPNPLVPKNKLPTRLSATASAAGTFPNCPLHTLDG